ncbi:MAG: hypothetical protein L3K11_02210 [Thermoplasmata archaeon]|nr:hypothetical protein [Thermoplasmata archaeon]
METEVPARAATADHARRPPRTAPFAFGAFAALTLLAVTLIPLGSATPASSAGFAPAATVTGVPVASWAWGAAENVSVHLAYAGAYTSALNLSGGNLTSTGAYVAVNESFQAGYLSYAVVNVSAPTASTRSVEVAAVELRSVVGAIGIVGTLPQAGTYAPGASVPLAPTSSSLWLSEQTVNGYRAFANYTVGANGSLGLTDEHLAAVEAINVSLAAVNFPNSTVDPNGSTTLKYVTASLSEAGWVAENLSAQFAPALLVSDPPLSVGKSWNSTTRATFVGEAAYASEISGSANGTTILAKSAGAASLNASTPLRFTFDVTGTESLQLPNGTRITGYTVAYTAGSGSGTYRVWDGLLVLPGSDATHSAGLRPATPVRPAADPIAPQASPVTSAVLEAQQPVPVAAQSHPTGGPVLLASPVTPQQAQSVIHRTSSPGIPALPTGSDSGRSNAGSILPVLLLGGLVVVIGGFFVVEARRGRARQ